MPFPTCKRRLKSKNLLQPQSKRRRLNPLEQTENIARFGKERTFIRNGKEYDQSQNQNFQKLDSNHLERVMPIISEDSEFSTESAEQTLFTIKQVQLMYDRLLQETKHQLLEEYEKTLKTKLAEQYDVFVKFTYDQLRKQWENAPSYLN